MSTRQISNCLRRLALGICLFYTGCDAATTGSTRDAPRTFSAAELGAAKPLEVRQDLRLAASQGGEVEFFRIKGIAVSNAGTIFLLDNGNNEVYALDSSGALRARFGRTGQGPGEFAALLTGGIAVLHDTVFVAEQMRLHAFTLDGRTLYSSTVPAHGVKRPGIHALVATTRGLVLLRYMHTRAQPNDESEHRDTILVELRTDRTERGFTDGMTLAADEWHPRGRNIFFARLHGPKAHVAVTPAGEILYTQGDDYVLDVFSPDGTHGRSVSAGIERIPITRGDIDRLIQKSREPDPYAHAEESASRQAETDKHWSTVPRAELRPVVGRLLPGEDEMLLVERLDFELPPSPTDRKHSDWDLLRLSGSVIGRVRLPSEFNPMLFHGRHIYGTERDSLGVMELVRFQITW